MKTRTYAVRITGERPLILHNDNLNWADTMTAWGKDPANTKNSVAGDDRTPAFRWLGCLYHNAGNITIPADNLMTMLREGGARCPTGKRGGTFKKQTQSGLVVNESDWNIQIGGKPVPVKPFLALQDEPNFEKHIEAAEKAGFMLFVKRARIGQAKHVRVRPRFDEWAAEGTISVFDEQITEDVLRNILTFAGAYAGIGDWRPSSPKSPGPFGKFTAEVQHV